MNKRQEKKMLFFLAFALLAVSASIVIAYPTIDILQNVTSSKPIITVTFPGETDLIEIVNQPRLCRFLNSCQENIQLRSLVSNEPNKFLYTTDLDLTHNQYYLFSINYRDPAANAESSSAKFKVFYDDLSIFLVQPENGASREEEGNITITTNRPGICRYNFVGVPPRRSFADSTIFDKEDNNFFIREHHNFIEQKTMYVLCQDILKNNDLVFSAFDIYYDIIPPSITHVATNYRDNKITDFINTPRGFETVADVFVDTDEKTICSLSEDNISFILFPGYNEREFLTSHRMTIFPIFSEPNGSIRYTITCLDRAYWNATSVLDIKLDTSVNLSFTSINTKEFYRADETVYLNVSLNKRTANCEVYDQNDIYRYRMENHGHTSLDYTFALGRLGSGSYRYTIKCYEYLLRDPPLFTTTLAFSVDTTPPIMKKAELISPLVNNSQVTYFTDQLSVRFEAEDNESGIASFSYAIINTSAAADNEIDAGFVNPTGRNGSRYIFSGEIDGLSLVDGSKYYLWVNATDKVMQLSAPLKTNVLTVDVSKTPITCSNNRKDGSESDVDCGSSCPAKCSVNKHCVLNQDCVSNYCKNGNCTATSCRDEVWNGNESDVDCGGSCRKCDIGDNCDNKDRNCDSGYCDRGTNKCDERLNHCLNNQFDPPLESDIDCGIDCDVKCDTNEQCEENSDCKSKICKSGLCQAPSCTDKIANQDESDVDCGSACPTKCGLNKKCLNDFDCESESCVSSICEESRDRDHDGIPTEWETQHNLNPDDPADALQDPDNDGLNNKQEYEYGTDPRNPDSDGDGYNDGYEVEQGFDPMNPDSKPKSKFWLIVLTLVIIMVAIILGYLVYLRYQQMQKKKLPPMKPITQKPVQQMQRPVFLQRMMQQPMPPQPKPEQKPAPPEKEWLTLSELAHKKKANDVFEKLSKISKKTPEEKKDIFSDLDDIAGQNVKKSHIKKLVKSESLPKEDLLRAFHKLAAKKVNEDVVAEIDKALVDLEKSHKHLKKEIKKVDNKLDPLRKMAEKKE